ncbi:ankyrin repeat domain-containing protein [Paenibacillus xylanexedens]|uniref:ankyrin repeat domain-containing protein n=1 Tax=Paenibacillus xylanexedens TaxID=528191 RepID=UPI00164329B2|nr:ankyrin repeat domain-containing protein [Paenibacillus xylanexedens]
MIHREYKINRAIVEGDMEYVQEYLNAGNDPNGEEHSGWTLLMLAAEHERIDMADLLISHGANVNHRWNEGWTALHQAVDLSIDGTIQTIGVLGEEPTDMIEFLLNHGADMNIEAGGESPLDMAISYGSEKITNFLKEYKRSDYDYHFSND